MPRRRHPLRPLAQLPRLRHRPSGRKLGTTAPTATTEAAVSKLPPDSSPSPNADGGTSTVKRREFLKVVGATTAAVAAVGCTSEKVGNLIPYLVSPDQTVPGVSTYYATTCRECAAACGII